MTSAVVIQFAPSPSLLPVAIRSPIKIIEIPRHALGGGRLPIQCKAGDNPKLGMWSCSCRHPQRPVNFANDRSQTSSRISPIFPSVLSKQTEDDSHAHLPLFCLPLLAILEQTLQAPLEGLACPAWRRRLSPTKLARSLNPKDRLVVEVKTLVEGVPVADGYGRVHTSVKPAPSTPWGQAVSDHRVAVQCLAHLLLLPH